MGVSIAATVPTQAAPMTVSLAFSSVSELAANHSLALSMIAGTTTIDMKIPWIGLGANTTTNASRKADKAYTNMVRTVDYCLARRMQTPDMPGAPSLGMATIAR
ncbi:hypothetical protein J4G43_042815 [Bradyrhizobium barranii subsp. barranii]|uniref:Uncharacterized protein n=1 Tax=Bradyrhizobium barranii subsp. barranii TaxID=2823807 RepID=A0A939S7C0_9BRAD|nr:hypothetical protein [Bradyrhizobium barranii]UEM11249.1 hypothetical protein J4G43_042815 [Bradyrhizobium barranii subsp. barranii]